MRHGARVADVPRVVIVEVGGGVVGRNGLERGERVPLRSGRRVRGGREQRNQQLDDPRLGWAGVEGLRRGKAVDAEGVGTSRRCRLDGRVAVGDGVERLVNGCDDGHPRNLLGRSLQPAGGAGRWEAAGRWRGQQAAAAAVVVVVARAAEEK